MTYLRSFPKIAVVLFTALCFVAGPGLNSAQAVTFSPSSPLDIDFGDVPLGGLVSTVISLTVTEQPGESIISTAYPGHVSVGDFRLDVIFGCSSSGATCQWTLSFAPSVLGVQAWSLTTPYFFQAITTFGTFDFILNATGTGVSPVPLPAALPLFATGIGVMGLLGWRRKRKKTAAVAEA